MFDVITIGSATRDVFLFSRSFTTRRHKNLTSNKAFCFATGAKIEVEKMIFATGGGGTNSAATFARLGLRCACLSKVGDDPGGRAAIADLEKHGVDSRLIIKTKNSYTAYAVIISAAGEDRTILVYRGASKKFTGADIPFGKLKSRWLYVTSLGGNVVLLKKITQFAVKHSIKLALNPGAAELGAGIKELKEILQNTDVLFLNREEAARLTGRDNLNYQLATLGKTIGRGIVVITLGQAGLVATDGARLYRANVLPGRVVERSGAGDAFGSGFIAGLMKTSSVEYAIQLGSANATAVIRQVGAKNGLLSKSDLSHFRKVSVLVKPR